MECLFCKIINGEIPSKIVYTDDQVIAFDDINPQAPHHKIIIPRKHIPTFNDLKPEDKNLAGHMVQTGVNLAKNLNIDNEGYRLVMNCNSAGGQEVYHIHLHLIGGRQMKWPPG